MNNRKKLIQLVHIGAAKLFPDDDARRAWQQARTGHASCKDMTDVQLENLVKELKRKRVITKGRTPGGAAPADKILALWIELKQAGKISDGSERALGRWLYRQHGKYSPGWLTTKEAMRAIESLKQWLDRPNPPKGVA